MKEEIQLFKPYVDRSMLVEVAKILDSGAIAGGKMVEVFEDSFSRLIGSKNLITTNDMSSAIEIALKVIETQSEDEVITSPFACMSTNAPISLVGAQAIWADVDPSNGLMLPESVNKLISKKTKAVILYHLAGYPGYVEEISRICKSHNVILIEDCDNALLAEAKDKKVGTFGDFAIFSFYPNRHINATEGGALTCKSSDHAVKAKLLRRYGIDIKNFRDDLGEINPECDIPEIGMAATFNNLCSAIALTQITSVKERITKLRSNAKYLSENILFGDRVIQVLPLRNTKPSNWVYLIRSDQRDRLMKYLKGLKIHCSKLHQLNYIYSGFGNNSLKLPGCETFMDSILAIPCGWWLDRKDLDLIIEALNRFK